jgi:hypothetical protein
MVCPPDPCVINNYIVAIDAQVDGCAPNTASANAKKHIVQSNGILSVARFAPAGADLQQHR